MQLHKELPTIVVASSIVVAAYSFLRCHNVGANKPQATSGALVTFIIPSINRPTLEHTIRSLQAQHNPNWEAIIVFDGIKPSKITTDPRIKLLTIPKTGQQNHAGEVRNQGMQQASSEWIAFVDDDDCLSPDYVDCLVAESKSCPSAAVIIFRMWHPEQKRIIPPPEHTDFLEGHVGISFSVRTSLHKQQGFKFVPGPTEDFVFIDAIRRAGYKMVLSPHVTYWVRGARYGQSMVDNSTPTRAYINE